MTELRNCYLSLAEAATSKFFVATKLLSRQTRVFVATNIFCRDKKPNIFCRDKHTSVATKDVFYRDKHMYVAKNMYVATKMILVAAPASDSDGTPSLRARLVPQLHCTILGTAVVGAQLTPLCFTVLRFTAFCRQYNRYGEQVADAGESSQQQTYPKKGWSRHRGRNGRLRADAQRLFLFVTCNKNRPKQLTWNTR